MLVAGHETTGSALTWTMYLLARNPDKMAKAQEEVDRVLSGGKVQPTMADYGELRSAIHTFRAPIHRGLEITYLYSDGILHCLGR